MNRLGLVFLFVALLASSSYGLEGEEIRGGDYVEEAVATKFGYQISLEIMGHSFCGGSIIDDRWVVTAAHCIINEVTMRKMFPMKVVAGIQDLKKHGLKRIEVDVDRAYVPRKYLTNIKGKHVVGDIAVLKLRQSLNLKKNTHLQKLDLPKDKTYTGEKAQISGYGWQWVDVEIDRETGEAVENGGTNGRLRYADTKVISQEDCTRRYFSVIPMSSICAQVVQRSRLDPEGVCSGDSGGPLVHDGKTLIGVVSTSPLGCMENVRPGIYTRVSFYLDFVKGVLAGKTDSKTLGIPIP